MVLCELMNTNEKSFLGLGIIPGILEILSKLNFTTPTPIQEQAIPHALEGKDIMGIAQTGTGKTYAFGIPLIQSILQKGGTGLVVAPTRELAEQIQESLRILATPLGLKTVMVIGGESIQRQIRDIRKNPQIVIGTPGRIVDHLTHKTLSLSHARFLILDEADRMLDMGFAPQLKNIIEVLPYDRQTMLFSATMPQQITKMAEQYMQTPIRVEIARAGSVAKDVSQEIFFIPQEEKPRLLEKILQDYTGSVLVFTRTKFGAKKLANMVRKLGHAAVEIHSNRSLNQRKEALLGFKTGKYRVLVATDVAARGIDVHNIELVVNYDLPEQAEDYVHRIGRTGRAGGTGHAISFARLDQRHDVIVIERIIRAKVPVSKLPDLPPRHEMHTKTESVHERNFSHVRLGRRTRNHPGSLRTGGKRPGAFRPGEKKIEKIQKKNFRTGGKTHSFRGKNHSSFHKRRSRA